MNEEHPPVDPIEDQAVDRPDASLADPDAPPPPASVDSPEGVAADADAALVEELERIAEAAAAAEPDPDEVATAFSEDLDPETRAFGAPKPQAIVCQWCNGALESTDLEVCPHCGSRLRPTDADLVVPGVTTLSSEAARAIELAEIQRNREAAKTGQAMYTTPSLATAQAVVPAPDEATVEAANRPPDDEVRRLMLEMELEARQARATAAARSDIETMIVADAEHEAADGGVADAAAAAPGAAPAEPDGAAADDAVSGADADTAATPSADAAKAEADPAP